MFDLDLRLLLQFHAQLASCAMRCAFQTFLRRLLLTSISPASAAQAVTTGLCSQAELQEDIYQSLHLETCKATKQQNVTYHGTQSGWGLYLVENSQPI